MKKFLQCVATVCSVALLLGMIPFTASAQPQTIIQDTSALTAASGTLQAQALPQTMSYIVTEDTSRREPNVKHFRLSDGTYIAAVYDQPVHYQKDGVFYDIDNTLTADTRNGRAVYRNTAGELSVAFPQQLSDGSVSVQYQGYTVTFTLEQSSCVQAALQTKTTTSALPKLQQQMVALQEDKTASIQQLRALSTQINQQWLQLPADSGLTYACALPQTDIRYQLIGNTVKESIIIQTRPTTAPVYRYTLTCTGLTPSVQQDGSVIFRDQTGAAVMTIAAPYMWDAADAHSSDVAVTLASSKNGYVYTLTPSADWLAAKERVYPVTVDPTVTVTGSTAVCDTTAATAELTASQISSLESESNYIKVGHKYKNLVALLYTPLPEQIPDSATITKATLQMTTYRSGISSCASDLQLNALRITSAWDTADTFVTVDGLPASTDLMDAVIYNDADTSSHAQTVTWDVTRAAQQWQMGTATNYGIMIRANTVTSGKHLRFYDSDRGISAYSPTFTFSYRDTAGAEDYWTYTTVSAGHNGTASVNHFNGNLLLIQSVAGVAGNLMPVSLQFVYNSAVSASVGTLPDRWQSNYDLCITATGNTEYPYCLTDADGTRHYFTMDENVLKDEDGLGYTLTCNQDGGYTVTFKTGGSMSFDQNGWLSSLSDSNGNTVQITRNGAKITSITDGADRTYIFTYQNGLLSAVGAPDATTNFTYTNGLLTGIVREGRTETTFAYDANGYLVRIDDVPENTFVKGSYSSTKRVTGLQLCNTEDSVVRSISFSYTHGETAVSSMSLNYANPTQGVMGQTTYYQFNAYGHTVCIRNASGMAVYYEYGAPGGVTGSENHLLSSSALQSNSVNLLQNASFESGQSAWTTNCIQLPTVPATETPLYRAGTSAYRIQKTEDTAYSYLYQTVSGLSAGNYTASVYLSAPIAENTVLTDLGGGVCLFLQVVNAENTVIATYRSEYITRFMKNDGWQRLSVSAPLPADCSLRLCVGFDTQNGVGIVYVDDAQLEKGESANHFNLLQNASLVDQNGWTFCNANNDTATGIVSSSRLQITGDVTARQYWEQTVTIGGNQGDVYTFGAVATAAASTAASDVGTLFGRKGAPAFRITAAFIDAETQSITAESVAEFNPGTSSSQTASAFLVAPVAYSAIRLRFEYSYNVNTAYFSAPYLYKENYGQSYTYDGAGNIISVTDVENALTAFAYSDNRLATLVNPSGSGFTYAYQKDTDNLLIAHSADGQRYTFTYDQYGNPLTSSLYADPCATSLEIGTTYHIRNAKTGRYLTVSTSQGKVFAVTALPVMKPVQQWTLSITDSTTNALRLHSYLGIGTVNPYYLSHDSDLYTTPLSTNMYADVRILSHGNGLFEITVNGLSLCATSEEENAHVYRAAETGINALIYADTYAHLWYFHPVSNNSNRAAITTSATYTEDGNYQSTATDALGNTVRYEYDEATGKLLSFTDAKNNTTTYTYDTLGRQTAVAAGDSTVQYVPLTGSDKLAAVLTANGGKYAFDYTSFGQTSSVTVGNVDTDSVYTLATNTYDVAGRLTQLLYGNGNTQRYSYDILDRITALWYNNNKVSDYVYDASGNLSLIKDYLTNTRTRYLYDLSGRLVRARTTNGASADGGDLQSQLQVTYEQGRDRVMQYAFTLPFAKDSILFTYNATHLRDAVSSLRIGNQKSPWAVGYLYDAYGRMSVKRYYTQNIAVQTKTWYYTYNTHNDDPTAQIIGEGLSDGLSFRYTYDANGNITQILKKDTAHAAYTYDSLGQLTRVDSAVENKSYVYAYDVNGNILSRKTYAYTTGELGAEQGTVTYGYNDAVWRDLLTNYNGTAISYDAIGNPTNWRDGISFTWQNGRQLSGLQNPDVIATYTYDEQGLRTQKTLFGAGTTTYYYQGGMLLGESRSNGVNLVYYYDEQGLPFGLQHNGTYYFYLRNMQGDILGLMDANGTIVAQYTYDAWGKLLSVTNADGVSITNQNHIGNINPLRYRGYYYDTETGFYYLQSRYYDPEVGRFLNADDPGIVTATPMSLTDKNLFAYCDNNPVMRQDADGEFWDTVFDIISLAASIVDVCVNSDDPWAWAGLVGDVVDLIPFVTCVGEATRAVKAIDKVADTVQIAKAVDFTDDAADIVKTLDRSSGFTKSTASAGRKIHQGYKVGDGFNLDWKEYKDIKGIRPDYVDFDNKIIYELKPMNPRSVRSGIRQLQRYNKALGGGFTMRLELY